MLISYAHTVIFSGKYLVLIQKAVAVDFSLRKLMVVVILIIIAWALQTLIILQLKVTLDQSQVQVISETPGQKLFYFCRQL